MEFDELQAQWAEQKQEDMYEIDQKALRRNVVAKRKRANGFSDKTEQILLGVNLFAGCFLLVIATFFKEDDWAMYVVAVSMLCMAGYVAWVRMSRLRASGTFGRSITGELDQAISDTQHRVRISQISLWYLPVVAVFLISQFVNNGKPLWATLLLTAFFALTLIAGRWEHRKFHRGRLIELERMRDELGGDSSLV